MPTWGNLFVFPPRLALCACADFSKSADKTDIYIKTFTLAFILSRDTWNDRYSCYIMVTLFKVTLFILSTFAILTTEVLTKRLKRSKKDSYTSGTWPSNGKDSITPGRTVCIKCVSWKACDKEQQGDKQSCRSHCKNGM